MQANYHKFYSGALGQGFELKVYGSSGKPVMAFPTSCGRFFDYEDRGMIAAMTDFIERGDIMVVAVDSRDTESWYKPERDVWMSRRHAQYEECITREVLPLLRKTYGVREKIMATGNSFGAFHAANFFLKFPDMFDSAVCLSGLYSLKSELDGYSDAGVYFNEPLSYLPWLQDETMLYKLRQGYLVVAHGGGAWENFNSHSARLAAICADKGIPCWYDAWGSEWPHDWHTWHAQIKKFLEHFRYGVLHPGGPLKLVGPDRRLNPLP